MTTWDLANIADIGIGSRANFAISPDGRYVAYAELKPDIEQDTVRTTWVIQSISGKGEPVRIGSKSEVIINYRQRSTPNGALSNLEARWSPDGEWIAYPVKIDGIIQLFRTKYDGSKTEQLTTGEQSLLASDTNETTFLWSEDGTKIYYQLGRDWAATRRIVEQEGRRGFYFDPDKPTVIPPGPILQRCGGTRHGDVSVGVFDCEIDYRVIEFNKSGKSRRLTEDEKALYIKTLEEKGIFKGYALLGEGKRSWVVKGERLAAWVQNADPDINTGTNPFVRIVAKQHGDSPPVICQYDVCMSSFYSRSGGLGVANDEVIFRARRGHKNSIYGIYAWSPETNELRTITQGNDFLFGCQVAGQEYICFSEGWTSPRKLIAVDIRTGRQRVIADVNPRFQQFVYTKVEKLEFEDGFGNPALGHLVYPKNYERGLKYPLVITQYRSVGFLRGGSGDEVPIHPLAAEGFFVLSFSRPEDSINHKAKDAWEAEKQQWSEFYEREMPLTALHNILDSLDRRGLIDTARIGLTGYSDGSETVGYALVNSDRFATAISSQQLMHPAYYYMAPKGFRKFLSETLGNPASGDKKWQRYAPANNPERVNAPLLINTAHESIVLAMLTFTPFVDANRPIELHLFPEGYHTKWRPAQRYNIYRRNMQWMKFWLKGEKVDDPVNPEQYERWKKLCIQHVENLKTSDDPKLRKRAMQQRCLQVT